MSRCLSRQSLLKNSFSVAAAVLGADRLVATSRISKPTMEAQAPQSFSHPGTNQNKYFVTSARSLKPRLNEIVDTPRATVRLDPDTQHYLRWRVEDDRLEASLCKESFKKGDAFIIDFGSHRAGYLEFQREGSGRSIGALCRLQLTFGEVPGDVAESLYPHKGGPSSSWLPVEAITVDVLLQRVRLPRRYVFRFVKVEILDAPRSYSARFSDFKGIGVTSAGNALKSLPGAPTPIVSIIDEVALRTLRDCMQATFEDGARRDLRLWIDDLRLQAWAICLIFRICSLVKRNLCLFAGLSWAEDGLLRACGFEKSAALTTDTYIPDYAALYGSVVLDYVHATNDKKSAAELYPVAKRQLDLFLTSVEDGSYRSSEGHWASIDWNGELDRAAAMQRVMIDALRMLPVLAFLIGESHDAAKFTPLIEVMEDAARAKFYDASSEVCVSGAKRQLSWASQAWMTLSGRLTKNEGEAALRKSVLEDEYSVKPTTPYLYHHVVETMMECGMHSEATCVAGDYWGGMVKAGADTCWVVNNPTLSGPPMETSSLNTFVIHGLVRQRIFSD